MAKQKKPPKERVKKQTSERPKSQIPRKLPSPHLREEETKSHSDFDSVHGIGELIGLVKLRAVEIKGALPREPKTLNDLLTHFTTATDEAHGLADEAVFLIWNAHGTKADLKAEIGTYQISSASGMDVMDLIDDLERNQKAVAKLINWIGPEFPVANL
jgi:hypothetical protein